MDGQPESLAVVGAARSRNQAPTQTPSSSDHSGGQLQSTVHAPNSSTGETQQQQQQQQQQGGSTSGRAKQKSRGRKSTPQQPMTTKIVDEFLSENNILLQAIDEATVAGRLDEATGYAEKLQDQLLMLAKLADTQVYHCGPPPREEDV